MNQPSKKSNGFFGILKNLFILMIFLQFAPMVFMNIKHQIKKALEPKTKVGKLAIRGMITNSQFYTKKIRRFLKDDEIKALLVTIESSGGLPASAQAILKELELFKKEKPVVVLVENICASAAYYIALGGHIIALPSSMVGSIGVFLQAASFKDLVESWKIKPQIIHSGKYKAVGHPLKDLTTEDIEYLQKLSDDNYNQFLSDVAQKRNLHLNKKNIWGEGKVFLGEEALKIGLIDQIGSYSDAIKKIKELAKIKTEVKFVTPTKPSGLMKYIIGDIQNEDEENGRKLSSKIATFLHEVYINFLSKETTAKIN